jgi:hypothetical protein
MATSLCNFFMIHASWFSLGQVVSSTPRSSRFVYTSVKSSRFVYTSVKSFRLPLPLIDGNFFMQLLYDSRELILSRSSRFVYTSVKSFRLHARGPFVSRTWAKDRDTVSHEIE